MEFNFKNMPQLNLNPAIDFQNDYIRLLKYQNHILKNIFVSGEDGVAVQKEIMKIMQEQGMADDTIPRTYVFWG